VLTLVHLDAQPELDSIGNIEPVEGESGWTGLDLSHTCHGLIWLVHLRSGRVAACLSSSSVHQPVDRHSSWRGCRRQTHAPVWRWNHCRANVGCSVVVSAGRSTWRWAK